MRLSGRNFCHGVERGAGRWHWVAVLNPMSANPGMRWDIETTRRATGYVPQDGAAPVGPA